MHATTLLQNLTEKSCPNVHKKRSNCLYDVVKSLIDSGQLWISALGRNIKNKTTVKHNIKKVDGLVGNEKLHGDRLVYYKYLASILIGTKQRPIIIVDWSSIKGDFENHILRASVTGVGRALTIYEEVHKLTCYANKKVHDNFLKNLSEIIPKGCRPIIVTDAGFRNPWFKSILKLGWDFVGRLRHNTNIRLISDASWQSAKSLHLLATTTPKYLGKVVVAKDNPVHMNMYLMLDKKKGRIKKTKQGMKCRSSNSKKFAKSVREPWLIITSLTHTSVTTKKIMKVYRMRMQIEESFRDLKDKRYGFRLPESGTKNIMRLENLLLIALLATFAIWLAGQVAIRNKWHYQLQANTVREKSVLSIAFIGLHILRHLQYYIISQNELIEAIKTLKCYVSDWNNL